MQRLPRFSCLIDLGIVLAVLVFIVSFVRTPHLVVKLAGAPLQVLPTLLGSVRQTTGSFAVGFIVLASVAFTAAISLHSLISPQGRWSRAIETSPEGATSS